MDATRGWSAEMFRRGAAPSITLWMALTLWAPGASAQVMYGISLGVTHQRISGYPSFDKPTFGPTAGAWANWSPVANSIGRFEANYVAKGGEGARLDYVEVPVLVGGASNPWRGGMRGALYTGLSLGVRVACGEGASADGPPVPCDQARTFDWAWPIGGMVGRWGYTQRMIALDVRYSLGLSTVFEGLSGSHRGWQFKLLIGLGRSSL